MPSFFCKECGHPHEGLPLAFGVDFRADPYALGSIQFERDGELVRASDDRFIRANVELRVAGTEEQFVWTCWVSLSHESYERIRAQWDSPGRESQEPAFGWLYPPPTYEPIIPLKTRIHTRPLGLRPWVELEPTDHPLAIEQRDGIRYDRIARIYHWFAAQQAINGIKGPKP